MKAVVVFSMIFVALRLILLQNKNSLFTSITPSHLILAVDSYPDLMHFKIIFFNFINSLMNF